MLSTGDKLVELVSLLALFVRLSSRTTKISTWRRFIVVSPDFAICRCGIFLGSPSSSSFARLPPSYQRLKLQGWILSLEDIRGLESLTGLQELHIRRTTNYPTGLRCLSGLTGLRSLILEEIDYRSTIPQEFCGLSRSVARAMQ